ncbi:hypothetical protein QZM46_08410 [Burkholderia vietnamiensis]|jgi:hypothetical protein|uniref:Uncharacterized protein n=1 Tax=Burkholderia vietnamiensis TaxID=60552 RepID=A0AAW7T140_BURVI|nr:MULTISPECIES: hypothetical protein [Burkholderia]AIO71109.1 hypothetical protein DM80_6132 [Burkholderia multivorans]MBH9646547.1 hypothetical protein [Burkholderia vietnamiensis]MBR7913124.1 hypothetical protein [Burkholderia vietnamiensis]MBR8003413.1 hypothetical protein [Burkholderia vietnamiensis]MBR8009133.1 hypothetical protein [Burkholderia vietnamiensis]
MAVTGYTQQQLSDFLENGGRLTFKVHASDIDETNGDAFERSPSIAPQLMSGFELPPTSIVIDDVHAYVDAQVRGDFWTRIVTAVYAKGGRIVYRKTGPQIYDAEASWGLR